MNAALYAEQCATLERYAQLPQRGLGFDTETHLVQPGLVSPPLVCGSAAVPNGEAMILDKDSTLHVFRVALESDRIIIGANLAFDVLVMVVHAARLGVDLMPLVFAKYERGEMYDLQIAEALHAIANGTLGKDPRTGKELADFHTGKRARYSLEIVKDLVLGLRDAKVNDRWRLAYALLEHLPISQWPEDARVYPVDDARNTLDIALAQCGHLERPGAALGHEFRDMACVHCGVDAYHASGDGCVSRKARHRNLHEVAAQTFTHFAMHLGAAWGFTVDQAAVDALEAKINEGREDRERPFFDLGMFRWKKEKGVLKRAKVQAAIKRRVALAYGAKGVCEFCQGIGKQPSPGATMRACGRKCTGPGCATCGGSGQRWDKLRTCKPCDGTGLVLESASVPRTDGSKCKPCGTTGIVNGEECEECDGTGIVQGVSMERDALNESGDEDLYNLATIGETEKVIQTYIPWFRGTDKDGVPHVGVPLTLHPNVILSTGRTSYMDPSQTLPRKGGVRECIVARPGRVLCSVDYEGGELVTHAQSCRWIVGRSALGDALNQGVKVHNAFAASMMGISYEVFQERFAAGDRRCKDTRQAAKPGNFGFPGRMGAAALVRNQRKQGPDTACEMGSTWILDDDGNLVRGYKGLRFCILMDGASRCGESMVTEWNGRPTPPLCKRCCECAQRLRERWLEQWPENVEYFEFVKHCEEHGQPLSELQAKLFGTSALGPGEIVQHVSNRIRGPEMGKDSVGNAIANGWFQGLLADAAKSSLRRIVREMYVRGAMPDGSDSVLLGSRFQSLPHDELISELFEETAHDSAHRISDVMVEELRRYCPDQAPSCFAEPAIMRRLYKGASPWWRIGGKKRKGPEDRLVPWEPPVTAKVAA